MRFFKSFILLTIMLVATQAFSLVEDRQRRDIKLPTQQMIEKQTITNPAAAGTNEVLVDEDGPSSAAAATVSTFVAQPDVPRNLVMTPTGTTADVAACDVVVNGTNIAGVSISETFTFAENASSATTGSKAFSTVTSVVFPASCEDSPYGATWDIGYGEKLGLKRCLGAAGHLLFSTVAGAYESTRATMAIDVDDVEGNTADFDGTMNGSNDFEIFFFQNFNSSCLE